MKPAPDTWPLWRFKLLLVAYLWIAVLISLQTRLWQDGNAELVGTGIVTAAVLATLATEKLIQWAHPTDNNKEN